VGRPASALGLSAVEPIMISSVHNERVKYIRSLARRRVRQREGRFVVEGTRLIDEMARAGVGPALLLYTASWAATPDGQRLLPALAPAAAECWLVGEAALAACADTESPQGVLAVVPFVQVEPRPGPILVLDQLRDPGNLGTILRSAEAAGIGQVILAPGTVDVYNPKVVRGAMGAHFRLPVAELGWPQIAARVAGRAVWLAEAGGDVAYDRVDWQASSVLIVGGEAQGAGRQAARLASGRVCIPMAGGTESLNAAMATTVILFEMARQRRGQGGPEEQP
jgi:TrmH family RNA methyltransferase